MTTTFCRHNRFIENCPICSKKARVSPGTVAGKEAASRSESGARRTSPAQARHEASTAARTPKRRSSRSASNVVVRRVARAVDDGYEHDLVPGLRASEDATRLAAELVWSAARLEQLKTAPPSLYGEIAALEDREEALWRCFLLAYLSPLEGVPDPFAAIRAAFVPWATGELPALENVGTGPRTAHLGGQETVVAYRAWAARAGGQQVGLAGEEGWDVGRRFDRAYERLALPRFGRLPRYELVTLAGALGLVDVEATSLQLASDPASPVVAAAKRIFGIGDPLLLARRAGELAAETGIPLGAFDLALQNWARADGRMIAGAEVDEDPAPEQRVAVAAVLGV